MLLGNLSDYCPTQGHQVPSLSSECPCIPTLTLRLPRGSYSYRPPRQIKKGVSFTTCLQKTNNKKYRKYYDTNNNLLHHSTQDLGVQHD
jgi:hypothetical protein